MFFFLFHSNRLLEKTRGIEELGGLRWELFGCLVFAWVIVYLCIFKGVKSTGKVRKMTFAVSWWLWWRFFFFFRGISSWHSPFGFFAIFSIGSIFHCCVSILHPVCPAHQQCAASWSQEWYPLFCDTGVEKTVWSEGETTYLRDVG